MVKYIFFYCQCVNAYPKEWQTKDPPMWSLFVNALLASFRASVRRPMTYHHSLLTRDSGK